MALQFSDTENDAGIVQLIDDECGSSSDSYPLTKKARDVNLAAVKLLLRAIMAAGRWQMDDASHEKAPIISTDLIQGQRDYSFLKDEEGSYVLDLFKVMVADQYGIFREMTAVDARTDSGMEPFFDELNVQGIPTEYSKTGNTIYVDPIPSYNYRKLVEGKAGLKAFVNREQVYFSATDTDKVLGFAPAFHEYLAIEPAWKYANREQLSVAASLAQRVIDMEAKIDAYFGNRIRDERPILGQRITKFK